MTAPTPHDHAERVEGEVTAAVRRGAEDLRSLYLTDQTEPVSRYFEEAATVLDAALDVEEMARALYMRPNRDRDMPSWEAQTDHVREWWREYARAIRAALLGGAA